MTPCRLPVAELRAALAASLGSMVVGFTTAWSSPAIASLQQETTRIPVTDSEASWIGSLMPLAAIMGGVLGGLSLHRLGRKVTSLLASTQVTILSTCLPFCLAGLVVSQATSITGIYLGRALAGLAIGAMSLSLPVYLAECLSPLVRGRLGLLPTTLGNAGMLLCLLLGAWLDWLQLAMVGAFLPLPFMVAMLPVAESPTFLLVADKPDQAMKALKWLRGDGLETEDEFVTMKQVVEDRKEEEEEVAITSSTMRPLAICMVLMLFQQLSGINAVMFYSVSIFIDSGSPSPHASTITLGVVNIAATIVSSMLVDRVGRKKLLYTSSLGMAVSLGVLGLHYHAAATSPTTRLVALVVYIVSFSLGFGPVPWLLMGELLPARVRGPAAAVTTGSVGTNPSSRVAGRGEVPNQPPGPTGQPPSW